MFFIVRFYALWGWRRRFARFFVSTHNELIDYIFYIAVTMDAISGWAGKMFIKQKMGSITESLPKMGGDDESGKKKPGNVTSKQMRSTIKASRDERDAEMERQKMERSEKKAGGLKISERWAANKEANR
jgi:hypothetical protein